MIEFDNPYNCHFNQEELSESIINECREMGELPKEKYIVFLAAKGYPAISIKHKTKYVHRLLAGWNIGDIVGMNVHHIDNNRLNNELSNLKILGRLEHRKEHYYFSNEGKNCGNEITIKQRPDITCEQVRKMRAKGMGYKQIAEELHCSQGTICHRIKQDQMFVV